MINRFFRCSTYYFGLSYEYRHEDKEIRYDLFWWLLLSNFSHLPGILILLLSSLLLLSLFPQQKKRSLYLYHDAIYQLYTSQKSSFLVASGIDNTTCRKQVHIPVFLYTTCIPKSVKSDQTCSVIVNFFGHFGIPRIYQTYTMHIPN